MSQGVATNGLGRVAANGEMLTNARAALDELAGSMIKSRSSGTFGVRVTIYEGRLTAIVTTQETRMEPAQTRH